MNAWSNLYLLQCFRCFRVLLAKDVTDVDGGGSLQTTFSLVDLGRSS